MREYQFGLNYCLPDNELGYHCQNIMAGIKTKLDEMSHNCIVINLSNVVKHTNQWSHDLCIESMETQIFAKSFGKKPGDQHK